MSNLPIYHGGRMNILKKILVPIDGTVLSHAAFTQALNYAKIVHGEITVFHIIETDIHLPPAIDSSKDPPAIPLLETERRGIAESMVNGHIEKGNEENVKIEALIVNGHAASEIVKKSPNYDLIIRGCIGESSLKSLFLGSNAEKVARHASCSVMLVKENKKYEYGCEKQDSSRHCLDYSDKQRSARTMYGVR